MAIIKKTIGVREDVEKRKSHIVGENVNWYNHYGKQNGDFSKS